MEDVRGRVVQGESDTGVPGVAVVLVGPAEPNARGVPTETRLATASTDRRGFFTLSWDDRGAPARAALRLDVIGADEQVLAREPLRPAGGTGIVLLRIDATPLMPALQPVDPVAAAKRRLELRRQAAEVRDIERAGLRDELAQRITAQRDRQVRGRAAFREFVRTVVDGEHTPRSRRQRLVEPGASVAEASERAIREGIAARVDAAERVGAAVFAAGEAQALIARGEIPAGELLARLTPRRDIGNGARVRRDPLARICQEHHRVEDPCMKALMDEPTDDTPDSEDGVDGDGIIEPDEHEGVESGADQATDGAQPAALPLLVGNLVNDVAPPEEARIFRVATRAGLAEVEQGVNGFSLHSGPADVPAHYEFHHLQIAFEHVWQELFDDKLSHKGAELFAELVELGVDPKDFSAGYYDFSGLEETVAQQSGTPVDPPAKVIREFDITAEQWTLLRGIPDDSGELEPPFLSSALMTLADDIAQLRTARDAEIDKITKLVKDVDGIVSIPADAVANWKTAVRERFEPPIRELRREGDRIVQYADRRLEAPEDFVHFHDLLKQLSAAAKEDYRFSVYAANRAERSVNFGLVTTYAQRWEPVSYQVGRLVKTVPLAPKEVRRFTKRMSIKSSRAEKEVQNNVSSRRSETSETSRAEAEIVQKAMNRTNFQMNAEGGVSVGVASAKASSAFGQDAAAESQEVKKEFREAVFKAAQEYRSERTVEVSVSTTDELSAEESGELSNPNDELPVTYLFYELQRRYKVSEKIRRLTPIVLVAQEFPRPHEIDDDWIVAHDWILRRVILDDSVEPALDYLTTRIVGDEFALQEQYQTLQQHRRLVDDLGVDVVAVKAQVGRRYEALQRSIERRADALDAEEGEGFFQEGVEGLFGGSDESPEALRVREDAARDAYERAARDEKELLGRLERETTALQALTEAYTKALSEHLNRKAQIERLRVHVKQNIMYYMQAIWSHEPPDQRFFRLHDVRVPDLAGTLTYTVQPDPDATPVPPLWEKPHKLVAKCKLDPNMEFRTLEEVADLDNLLGFKGNYMMFPLKQSNVLTDFMMTPYLDAVAGLRDPDPRGNWTLDDFVKYLCCLREHLTPADFDRLRSGLQEAYRELAADPEGDGEEVVTPTDSLFIEALPGAHPILEDFKLMHRAVDVKKAQAEVRGIELENLRFADRLLQGEREDPTIEKKIVIEGDGAQAIVPPDA